MSGRVSKAMTQPLTKARIQIWLYEQAFMRIEGRIIGFDEFMNVVLDDAEEVNVKTKARKHLGRILLKGDNITLIQSAPGAAGAAGGAAASSSATSAPVEPAASAAIETEQ